MYTISVYTTEGEQVATLVMKVTFLTYGECVLIKMVLCMSVILLIVGFKYFDLIVYIFYTFSILFCITYIYIYIYGIIDYC